MCGQLIKRKNSAGPKEAGREHYPSWGPREPAGPWTLLPAGLCGQDFLDKPSVLHHQEFCSGSWNNSLVPSGSHQYPEMAGRMVVGGDEDGRKAKTLCSHRGELALHRSSFRKTSAGSVRQCRAVPPKPGVHLNHRGHFPKCVSWAPTPKSGRS